VRRLRRPRRGPEEPCCSGPLGEVKLRTDALRRADAGQAPDRGIQYCSCGPQASADRRRRRTAPSVMERQPLRRRRTTPSGVKHQRELIPSTVFRGVARPARRLDRSSRRPPSPSTRSARCLPRLSNDRARAEVVDAEASLLLRRLSGREIVTAASVVGAPEAGAENTASDAAASVTGVGVRRADLASPSKHQGPAAGVLRATVVAMSLPTRQRRSVVFIGDVAADGDRRLRGTGFLVGVPTGEGDNVHLYLATASHVVPHYEPSFMRLRRLSAPPAAGAELVEQDLDETVVDVDLGSWHRHPLHDVAITLLRNPDQLWAAGVVVIDEFVDASPHNPQVGEDVFFAGLLAQVESMGERHVPMLRGGMIGALDQRGIRMIEPGGTLRRVDGHLIDCRSFGGFSGAPCFARLLRQGEPTPRLGLPRTDSHSLLLGVVGGHFDHRSSVDIQGDRYTVPTSAGVAIVYPCKLIRELLDDEDVIRERMVDGT
jgi:hypothetical protein